MTDQLQTAKDWLGDLSKIVSRQKTKEDYEYAKKRTEALDWLIQQAERVEELEESEREWVLFQAQVNCINQKLQQLNKRYREAMEKAKYESSHRIGDSGMIKIYEILSEALEGDCIHCNGKGFNGLDYCPQCNQMEEDDDN